jgi:molybdate transport system substrate-binding protein
MKRWLPVLAVALTACGGVAAPAATPDPVPGNVAVFAAASLTEAFNQVGTDFRARHRGAMVQFNFAGSSTLVTNLTNGAQADVFASADEPNMAKVTAAGLTAAPPRIFATNKLEIVVGAGNPKHITGLADLAQPGLIVVLAAPAVPAGHYAAQALQAAGVRLTPASLELDVKAVVSKVALGEADAGIVYLTDVRSGGARVAGVPIPDAQNVVARYPIAVIKGASGAVAGQAFVNYLLGADGQKTLAGFGFGGP